MVVIEWMHDILPLLRNHTFTVISSDVIDRLIKSRLTSLEASIWILCVCFLHISLCPSTRKLGSVSKLATPTPRAKCWPALSRYVISRRCHWLAFSYPLNCPFSSGLFFPSPAIITIWWTVTGSLCTWASAALGNCVILPAPARFSPASLFPRPFL